MAGSLSGKKVAVIVTDGFDELEFRVPLNEIKKSGAETDIISIRKGKIKSWANKNWSNEYEAAYAAAEVNAEDYDALLLPGGTMNPDKLRMDADVIKFVREILAAGKPVAAICHGPWTLIETGLMPGRTVTSYPSLKSDLINAGAEWVDKEVVVDHGLVTSRNPDDLPAFCKKMLEEFAEGVHSHQ